MPAVAPAGADYRSVFEIAASAASGGGSGALRRLFRFTCGEARAAVGRQLSAKYNVTQDNVQLVASITNLWSHEQTWYNAARTTKPQTFKPSAGAADAAALDPTANGRACDFCAWQLYTAADAFGRINLPHAVTGSNLFKYAEPAHGLVLFKQHDPLGFDQAALSDVLDAGWLWFQAAHQLHPSAAEPFLLWNCLPRAGASQFHGHAQVMLTEQPVPGAARLRQAAAAYAQQHPGCCYVTDLLEAHASVGLARQLTVPAAAGAAAAPASNGPGSQLQHACAWACASLTPVKDAELLVVGRHMCCPAFQRLLYAALRALIDGLGISTFNCAVLQAGSGSLTVPPPAGVGLARQHWRSGPGSDGGSGAAGGTDGAPQRLQLPRASDWAAPPVVARLVSRGKLGNPASDFGGLEVFGGASIGHTDPLLLVRHLDAQLVACQQDDVQPAAAAPGPRSVPN